MSRPPSSQSGASDGWRPAGAPASGAVAKLATEEVPDGVDYTQVLRTPAASGALSLMGVALGALMFLILTPLVTRGLAAVYWMAVGSPGEFADTYRALVGYELPFGLMATHLGLAMLIPISAGLVVALHRVRPGYLLSVFPGTRWRYFWIVLVVAFVTLNLVLVVQNLTAPGGPQWGISPQQGFVWFALAVLATSPLQAFAEEVFFRGYLMQAFGSMVRTPWFGILASAAFFAFFHGTQNLPLFLDRFAFGVLAGWLVVRTGGIEAGVAAHIANNVCAFLYAGLTTSIAEIKGVSEIGWADAAWDLARFGIFALVAAWFAARMRLRARTAPPGTGWQTQAEEPV